MVTTDQVQNIVNGGGDVIGSDGSKIGKVGQIFLDDETGQPEWVTVKTGMFGGAESFVPLQRSSVTGDDITVPFDKDTVKDAPRVDDSDGHLDRDEEAELYRYYGLEYREWDQGRTTGDVGGEHVGTGVVGDVHDHDHDHDHDHGTVGHDTSGPTTDDAMTRSEERVDIGTQRVSAGKVRLRKYIVTENVTKTVPVQHEEVRLEREPITDANRDQALSGGDLTTEEHEVDLTRDEVVVDKETVPVERVKLDKDTVTEEQQVTEEVRKEEIDTDGLDAGRTDEGRSNLR